MRAALGAAFRRRSRRLATRLPGVQRIAHDAGARVIEALAGGSGRGARPAARGRRRRGDADRLTAGGIHAGLEPFPSTRSFATVRADPLGLPRRRRCFPAAATCCRARRRGPVLRRRRAPRRTPSRPCSRGAAARTSSPTIEPRGDAERTLCLLSHLDTSRSGLMFHPRWRRTSSAAGRRSSPPSPRQGSSRCSRAPRSAASSSALLARCVAAGRPARRARAAGRRRARRQRQRLRRRRRRAAAAERAAEPLGRPAWSS